MNKIEDSTRKLPGNKPGKPLLRVEIEEAQRNTSSNAAAARWLNVSYRKYRKYAQLYNIFDRHLNQAGIGVDKGWSKRPSSISLKDILAGKHPKYSLAKLKNRLLARKKLTEECSLCGFHERRITDGRVPLMLTFKDGNRQNFELANLELLCYNCMFLTTGAPSVVNKSQITRSFTAPETIPQKHAAPMTISDAYDVEDLTLQDTSLILTEEEKRQLLES